MDHNCRRQNWRTCARRKKRWPNRRTQSQKTLQPSPSSYQNTLSSSTRPMASQSHQVSASSSLDLTKPWHMSDVELCTLNSNDVKLHASKPFLAVHSPYFHKMFFGFKQEGNGCLFELPEDFTVVHTALKILHHTEGFEHPRRQYSLDELRKIHNFGDVYEVRFLRDFCKEQFVQNASKETLKVAVQLDLHDVTSILIAALDTTILQEFLDETKAEPIFTGASVDLIVKRLAQP